MRFSFTFNFFSVVLPLPMVTCLKTQRKNEGPAVVVTPNPPKKGEKTSNVGKVSEKVERSSDEGESGKPIFLSPKRLPSDGPENDLPKKAEAEEPVASAEKQEKEEAPTKTSLLQTLSQDMRFVLRFTPGSVVSYGLRRMGVTSTKATETPSQEVDAAGYEEDWGTEHRSEGYPDSSKGHQHHPDYTLEGSKTESLLKKGAAAEKTLTLALTGVFAAWLLF